MSDHHDSHGHSDDHGDHGHHGVGIYIAVFFALCALTGASFLTYFDVWRSVMGDAPGVARTFMLAIACCKASLVILFFMHLKSEADWKYVLTIPASIMSVFLVLALIPDVGRRASEDALYQYAPTRKAAAATEADTKLLIEQSSKLAPHDAPH